MPRQRSRRPPERYRAYTDEDTLDPVDEVLLNELTEMRLEFDRNRGETVELIEKTLDRENLFCQFIEIFNSEDVWQKRFKFFFDSKEKTGERITCNGFCLIFEEALNKFDGVHDYQTESVVVV